MTLPRESTPHVLLADVDGREARVVLAERGALPTAMTTVACESQDQLIDILAGIREGFDGPVLGAAIAAPGPCLDGVIQLTHSPMRLEADVLSERLDLHRLHLVNNFTARALAVPLLAPDAMEPIGGGFPHRDAPAAAIGPSATGLGMSILNPDGFVGWMAAAAEGGHVDLAAGNDREADVIRVLRDMHGHVSAECVLSGAGVLDVAFALSVLAGKPARFADLPALLAAARGGDAIAREVFTLVSGWLGAISGNLVLTAGARSGVYVISAIVLSWGEMLDRAIVRQRFEAKGRMAAYLHDVPFYLVNEPNCGLLGLSALFA
ncbi:glucokinase [Caulobacter sp. 1776]|uniref:glucokinase n=1 Tax=Caulobacter sp. 1776 TaxID=3156420 RepID=UPI0033944184